MLARIATRNSSVKWVCPECVTRRSAVVRRPESILNQRLNKTANNHYLRTYTTRNDKSQSNKANSTCSLDSQSVGVKAYNPKLCSSNSSFTFRRFSAVPTPRPAQSINGPSPIPQSTSGLHLALRDLELHAANYISLARVKLAIKSVENGLRGTTRIAFLALDPNGKQAVERLLRVILADVLESEKDWEKQLFEQNDGRAILIKYGQDNTGEEFWNRLLRTIYVDSPLLKNNGIEILISTMDVHVGQAMVSATSDQRSVLDTFLVPMAETSATVEGGGISVVSYPVHRTVLVASGLEDLIELGRFEAGIGSRVTDLSEMIKVVVDSTHNTGIQNNEILGAVDITAAENGISAFRSDVSKSIEYEHAWFKSGIPELSSWLFESEAKVDKSKLKREIKVFIEAILSDTSARIDVAEHTFSTKLETTDSIDRNIREDLIHGAETWERRAHQELQTSLENAWHSPMWKKLAWWKLLWRVDDVGMIGLDVLRNHWLVRAEKELIYLFGRMKEARMLEASNTLFSTPILEASEFSMNEIIENKTSTSASTPSPTPLGPTSVSLYPDIPTHPSPPSTTTPYPTQITSARTSLTDALLNLQAKAQTLLLSSLTGASLGAAIAALVHVSSPLISFYESGAVAAFGLALAIIRLQSGWEKERKKFETTVRETGRTALIGTGAVMKEVVVNGGRKGPKNNLVDTELEIQEARKAIEDVKDALSIMGEK